MFGRDIDGGAPSDRQCAHVKKNGERCGKWAAVGLSVCLTPGHTADLPKMGYRRKRRMSGMAKARRELAAKVNTPEKISALLSREDRARLARLDAALDLAFDQVAALRRSRDAAR